MTKTINIKLREATIKDDYDLWCLRIDPVVAEQCFGEVPEFIEHQKWLRDVLENEKITLLIVEVEEEDIAGSQIRLDFAGQVRLDDKVDMVEISISLTAEYRGCGLAVRIIEEAIKQTDKDVIALIKRGNTASLRAFAMSGFVG